MRKFVKVVLIIIFLVVIAMLIVPFLFKGKVEEMVKEQANANLNAHVDFSGIDISLFRKFPNVYMAVNDLTISGKDNFELDTLAHIGRLSIVVNPLDLLKGNYVVKRISVEDPRITLLVLQDGLANWDIQLPAEPKEEVSPDKPSDFNLQLNRVTINRGFMILQDQQSSTYMSLNGLDLSLSGALSASSTTLKTSLEVESAMAEIDGITYLNHAALLFDAIIEANLDNDIYILRKNTLKINDVGLNLDGSVGLSGDDLNLMLTFNTPSNSFKDILSLIPAIYKKDFESLSADGIFELDGYIKGVYNENIIPSFRVNLNMDDGYFQYADLPSRVENISIHGAVYNDGKAMDLTVVDMKTINLRLIESHVKSSFFMKTPISDPFIKMSIDADLDLSKLKNSYPVEAENVEGKIKANLALEGAVSAIEEERYSDFNAMGSVTAKDIKYTGDSFAGPVQIESAQINFAPAYLDLVNFSGLSGNSDLTLKGKIENYIPYILSDGILVADFRMNSEQLNLNELFAGETTEEDEAGQEGGEMEIVEIPADLHLVFDGAVGQLDYSSLSMKNVTTRIEVKDRRLRITQLDSELFNGNISLTGTYDTWDPTSPLVDLSLKINGLGIRDASSGFYLLNQYAPLAEKVAGDLSGEISFVSLLNDNMLPRLSSIAGKGYLNTTPLEFSGINTLDMLSEKTRITHLKEMKTDPVNISFQFIDGIMNIKPFDLDYNNTKINISGWTSFDRDIAYTMNMAVPRELMGEGANQFISNLETQAGLSGDESAGSFVNLAALIGGSLDDPKVSVNLAKIGEELIEEFKEKAEEIIDKKTEEARARAKQEADRIMAEAEEQAQRILTEARIKVDQIQKGARELADETIIQSREKAGLLEAEGKDQGILAESAAKTAADQLRKEGDKQAQNIMAEADKKTGDIMNAAEKQADNIREQARARVDKL